MTDKTDSPQPVAEISHGRLRWAIPTPDYVLSQRYMNNDTHPLYTADQLAAAVAAERERWQSLMCRKEWEGVNDPPCHPSDAGWKPCNACSGGADKIREGK